MHLKEIRRDYKRDILTKKSVQRNPVEQFSKWINEAIELKIQDATAMSLISSGTNGFPQSRIVLLKDFDERGFTFFTDYTSDKGKAIELDNKVGLHFFWSELERQVRISGLVEKTNTEISKKYFYSRPQKSQVAASISEQSSEIPSRSYLESRYHTLAANLGENNPNYPVSWGGYLVKPVYFEFWQGRENRLHDRIVYEQCENDWKIKRLSP